MGLRLKDLHMQLKDLYLAAKYLAPQELDLTRVDTNYSLINPSLPGVSQTSQSVPSTPTPSHTRTTSHLTQCPVTQQASHVAYCTARRSRAPGAFAQPLCARSNTRRRPAPDYNAHHT